MKSYKKYNLERLLVLLKEGDMQAFNEVYFRYGQRVFGFLSSVYKNKELAEDVTQEVFIKIWEKKHSINCNLSFEGYIFTIARNLILDILKKQKRSAIPTDNLPELSSYEDTERAIYFNELNIQITNVIHELPDGQRKIFKMSRENGMKNEEIAQVLNISRRTVEHQIYRVLQKLKKELSKESLYLAKSKINRVDIK